MPPEDETPAEAPYTTEITYRLPCLCSGRKPVAPAFGRRRTVTADRISGITVNDTRIADPVVVNIGRYPVLVQRADVPGIIGELRAASEGDDW